MRFLSIIFALFWFNSAFTQESASLSKNAVPQKPTNSIRYETNGATNSQKNAASKPVYTTLTENDTSSVNSARKDAIPKK